MVRRAAAVAVSVGFAILAGCQSGPGTSSKKAALATSADSVSYLIGVDIAQSLAGIKEEVVLDVLMQGIRDKLQDGTQQISPEVGQQIMQEFSMRMQAQKQEKQKQAMTTNSAAGAKFLEENKTKPDVKTTPSGLQYIVVREGTGATPAATDQVKVHYKGTLIDGTEFDSSYKRGEPVTFPVSGVIPGWSEGLQLMKVGGAYKLFVPAALGYGERGAGAQIGPNATLIFEVELLDIVKK